MSAAHLSNFDGGNDLTARLGGLSVDDGYTSPRHPGSHAQSPVAAQFAIHTSQLNGPYSPTTFSVEDGRIMYYPSNTGLVSNGHFRSSTDSGQPPHHPYGGDHGRNGSLSPSLNIETFPLLPDGYVTPATDSRHSSINNHTSQFGHHGRGLPQGRSAASPAQRSFHLPHTQQTIGPNHAAGMQHQQHQQHHLHQQQYHQNQQHRAAFSETHNARPLPYWMGPPQGLFAGDGRKTNGLDPLLHTPHSPIHLDPATSAPISNGFIGSPTQGNFSFHGVATSQTPSSYDGHHVGGGFMPNAAIYGIHTPYSPIAHGGYGHPQSFRSHRRPDTSHVARSALLEDFRLTKQQRRWTLDEIFGHIVEFCGDQHGSRFIQQKLETCSTEEREQMFNEILPNAYQIMTDVFGNYVTQKMFEIGDQKQKAALAKKMNGSVLKLSMQMYGCRVVQKALEHVLVDQRDELIAEIKPHILECVKSNNANHVIQRLISLEAADFVVSAFNGHVEELGMHAYGCRVLQKALEVLPAAQTRLVIDELHLSTLRLIEDQFGNYVIQSIIAVGPSADRDKIIAKIKGKVIYFSRHKFASNVCEKALEHASPRDRTALIIELIGKKSDGSSNVAMLLRDAFANFPLQTALLHAEPVLRDDILALIQPQLTDIRHSPVGKRLEARILQYQADGWPSSQLTHSMSTSSATAANSSDEFSPSGSSSTSLPSPRIPNEKFPILAPVSKGPVPSQVTRGTLMRADSSVLVPAAASKMKDVIKDGTGERETSDAKALEDLLQ